jgi:hypothetical protein
MAIGTPTGLGTTITGGSAATSVSVTTTAVVPAGAREFLVVAYYNNETPSSTSGGLTWTVDAVRQNTSDTNYRIAILSAPNAAGSSSGVTRTVNWTGNVFTRQIAALYCTGLATSSPLDGTPVGGDGTDGSSTTWTTASLATSVADVLLVGGAWLDFDAFSSTPSNSFVEVYDFTDAGGPTSMVVQCRVVSATGSYASAGAWSALASDPWTAVMAAYKASSASASLVSPLQSFGPSYAAQRAASI